MCSSQVGNRDIENACERVDIWCLRGGRCKRFCSLMEQCVKDVYFLLPDPVISNAMYFFFFCEFGYLKVILLKSWPNTLKTTLAYDYESN